MSAIAVVVPTIRPTQYESFMRAWAPLFDRHQVALVTVYDGATPTLGVRAYSDTPRQATAAADILGSDADLIYPYSDVCRQLGYAYVARYLPQVEYILTLDDDVAPRGDTIADHLSALDRRVPISWLSSSPDAYTRGFPYGVRDEAPAMASHGVWEGNADWDAVTQLTNGNAPLTTFYRGPVPRGVLFPVCGMNLMIRRAALPYAYFAPMGPAASLDGETWDRFGDIWMGICLKRAFDEQGWALVSGYSAVEHTRASDPHANAKKEATGMVWNELFWQAGDATDHPYFALYSVQRQRWHDWVAPYV